MRHAPQPRAMCCTARVGPLQPAFPLVLLQLQAAAGQQAEALVGVAARMERLEKDIRDTGECIGLLFAVSAHAGGSAYPQVRLQSSSCMWSKLTVGTLCPALSTCRGAGGRDAGRVCQAVCPAAEGDGAAAGSARTAAGSSSIRASGSSRSRSSHWCQALAGRCGTAAERVSSGSWTGSSSWAGVGWADR